MTPGARPPHVLSAALLRDLIREEELPLRARELGSTEARIVLRRGAVVGSVIERHISIPRTMERARSLIRQIEERGESFPSGLVIVADEVTAGRGRFRRTWVAPRGGLWLTLVLVNTLLPENRNMYPLAAGLACCELARACGVEARIKWVNDVHAGGRKLAGILTETAFGPLSGEEYILIGIGINVNNTEFPPELARTAVSLAVLTGASHDLELLAARLLAKLTWNMGLLQHEEELRLEREGGGAAGEAPEDGGLSRFLARWRELSDSIGRRVLFGTDVQAKPEYEAEVLGIDPHGGLVLKHLASGAILVENSGEILYLGLE